MSLIDKLAGPGLHGGFKNILLVRSCFKILPLFSDIFCGSRWRQVELNDAAANGVTHILEPGTTPSPLHSQSVKTDRH